MEPTANALEVGCLGNLNATVTVRGRAAHSARPWLGENAIHAAIAALAPLADLPVARRRRRRARVPRGGERDHDRRRGGRATSCPTACEATRELPLRAGTHARGGGGAAPRAARAPGVEVRVDRQRAARAGSVRNPLVAAAPRRGRSRRRPEAGVDAGRGVRDGRGGRRQLRTGRPAVRSSGRRARRGCARSCDATPCCGVPGARAAGGRDGQEGSRRDASVAGDPAGGARIRSRSSTGGRRRRSTRVGS